MVSIMNTSCSDAAIAPLVASQLIQLSGLTAAMIARTRTTDLRGNPTEVWTELQNGVVTEKRRVPEATNIAGSRSRFGMSLESVSVSAVTNRMVYDALGRVVAAIDGRGNAVRTEYDTFGRRAASFDGAGNPTRYAYDRFGRLAAVTNALGHATVYEYDLRGRKTYEGGATYPVRYTYDVFGNKTTMMTYRDESLGLNSGDVTTWFYDEASGVMTNKVYADGKGPRYDYDSNGRLAKRTWARGIDTFYAYDGWGNLTNTTYSDDTPTVTIKYDALGRQVEAHDAAGVTTFAYDDFGANTNETVVGVAGTNVLERFADEFGRDAGYALNGERRTIIGHDLATGRIATMQIPAREGETDHSTSTPSTYTSFCWSYHPGSDMKSSLSYPNGVMASWQYDANNRLLQVRNATPTNVVSQFDYTYDAAGRRVQIAKSGSAFDFDDVVSYGYNVRSELTNAVSAVDDNYHYSYQYDPIGNRESSSERGMNTTYAANELNQYTQIAAESEAAFVPEFDDDGNQTLVKTATGIWRVTYNGENRPILWTCETANIVMSYDRMGRRVSKNDQCFVYNGYLQIANYHFPTQTYESNYFTWDPTVDIATRPLVWNLASPQSSTSFLFFYMHDSDKNASSLIDESGVLKAHYEYTPFGGLSVSRGASVMENPWRFSSEYFDDDTAMVYYNYRHYEAITGRWVQRDVIEGSILLEYSYANNRNDCYDWLGSDIPVAKYVTDIQFKNGKLITDDSRLGLTTYKPSTILASPIQCDADKQGLLERSVGSELVVTYYIEETSVFFDRVERHEAKHIEYDMEHAQDRDRFLMGGQCLCKECYNALRNYYHSCRNFIDKRMLYKNSLFDYVDYRKDSLSPVMRDLESIGLYNNYSELIADYLILLKLRYEALSICQLERVIPPMPPERTFSIRP